MKNLLLIALFFGFCASINAQNTRAVESAFSTGNAQGLLTELAGEVELNIGKDVQFLNGRQTVSSLNQWFHKVQPSAFSGRIAGGSAVKFYSGTLKSNQGSYKVLVYFDSDQNHKIDEIRISEG